MRRFAWLLAALDRERRLTARLERDNRDLCAALHLATEAMEAARAEIECVRADAELLAWLASDRPAALAFVRDRRRIQRLDEVTG